MDMDSSRMLADESKVPVPSHNDEGNHICLFLSIHESVLMGVQFTVSARSTNFGQTIVDTGGIVLHEVKVTCSLSQTKFTVSQLPVMVHHPVTPVVLQGLNLTKSRINLGAIYNAKP